MKILKNKYIWIIDSGASSHSTGYCESFVNKRNTNTLTIGATGPAVAADFEGDLPVTAHDKAGKPYQDFTLSDVAYKKTANFNLASMGTMLQKDWESHGNKNRILMTKGSLKISFDIVLPTKKGAIYAALLKPRAEPATTELEVVDTSGEETKMSYDRAHELLGHMGERTTRATAKVLGWTLTPGSGKICEYCAESKSKQKNVPKTGTGTIATEPNGRMY